MPEPIDVTEHGGIPTDAGPAAPEVAGGNATAASPYVADELTGPPASRGRDDDDGRSVLEVLEADLADAEPVVELDPLALGRNPDYVVIFRKITDGEEIEKARKGSRDPKKVDGIDGTKFAALIVNTACQRILRRGVVLADDEGRPLRFNHRALLQALHAKTVADCARLFYANDAELDSHARMIMTESGWGKDAMTAGAVDPQPAG